MNQYDMKGRHAVITGGATGLGYAIAERVLASGGSVTLWDRDVAGMSKAAAGLKHPGSVHTVQVDVSQHASVAAATEATLKNGPVDALVNSAGITGPNTQPGVADDFLAAVQQIECRRLPLAKILTQAN